MEKAELIKLYEAARVAADAAVDGGGPEEESRCLVALNGLKKFPVSYQLLLSSQVGKNLRRLTKHESSKIKTLASEVVEIWKEIVVKEAMESKKEGRIKSADATTTVKIEGNKARITSSSKVVVMDSDFVKAKKGPFTEQMKVKMVNKKEKLTSEVIAKSPSTEQTGVKKAMMNKPKQEPACPPKLNSVVRCKDVTRDKLRDMLAEALCKVCVEVSHDLREQVNAADPYRVAVLVETAMFEKWGKSNGSHKVKYRSIIFNIKDPKNPDFRRKVLLGVFPPHSITELTPEQMASETRQSQNEEIKRKALFECERGLPQEASTDQFRCSRCGKKETTYYQMQTRSADEPMTTYVTCVNCGKRMKFC